MPARQKVAMLIVILGVVGVIFSGLTFWMVNFLHQKGEYVRLHGRHCDVKVVGKSRYLNGEAITEDIHVRPLDSENGRDLGCAVTRTTYNELQVGQTVKAWVLGKAVVLDYGENDNNGSVAQTMFMACVGFNLMVIVGLILVYRWRKADCANESLPSR